MQKSPKNTPWLVLVGIKPQFPEMYRAAKELGFRVLSITQYAFPVPAKIRPDKLVITQDLTLKNLRKITKKELRGQKIAAFYTVREQSVIAVSKLNLEIKNKFINPHEMTEAFRDKHTVRELLQGTPYTIETALVDLENPKDPFPGNKKVVKPLSDGGSTGVILVGPKDNFKRAVAESKKAYYKNIHDDNLSSKATVKKAERYILVEKFIEGDNYVSEMFVHQGTPVCLSVVARAEMIAPYFEEAYNYAPVNLPKKTYDDIAAKSVEVIKKLGIEYGAVHMEVIYKKGKLTVVEVNLRSGGSGWFTQLVEGSSGMRYIKAALAQIAGQNPWPYLKKRSKNIMLLYVPLAREGGYIKAFPNIKKVNTRPIAKHIDAKIGARVLPRPAFVDYLGFYMFKIKGQSRDSYARLKKLLKQCDKYLRFTYQQEPLKNTKPATRARPKKTRKKK